LDRRRRRFRFLGFTARVGSAWWVNENHWLGMTLEAFPSFYADDYHLYGFALNFEWQLL
jgi:hypothetical protein